MDLPDPGVKQGSLALQEILYLSGKPRTQKGLSKSLIRESILNMGHIESFFNMGNSLILEPLIKIYLNRSRTNFLVGLEEFWRGGTLPLSVKNLIEALETM